MTPDYRTKNEGAMASSPPFESSLRPGGGAPPAPPSASGAHHVAARGFAQIFGLHPAIAFLTFIVDSMLFAGEVGTLGAILPLSIAAGVVLGIITFMAQKKWYGDDIESAFIKALILAFLTAIPTNLPAFVYVPAGIVGFFRRKK